MSTKIAPSLVVIISPNPKLDTIKSENCNGFDGFPKKPIFKTESTSPSKSSPTISIGKPS